MKPLLVTLLYGAAGMDVGLGGYLWFYKGY
jgi:hypothetical protein